MNGKFNYFGKKDDNINKILTDMPLKPLFDIQAAETVITYNVTKVNDIYTIAPDKNNAIKVLGYKIPSNTNIESTIMGNHTTIEYEGNKFLFKTSNQ